MFNGLGNNIRRTFAGIKNGKVVVRINNDENVSYDHIEGYIKKIDKFNRVINDKETTVIDILLDDGKGEEAILSLYADSGTTRTVLLLLGAVKDFKHSIRINARPKEGTKYTKVSALENGELLKWCEDPANIPAVKTEMYKGQEIKDPTERNEFYDKLLARIQRQLATDLSAAGNPVVSYEDSYGEPDPGEEDMPEM